LQCCHQKNLYHKLVRVLVDPTLYICALSSRSPSNSSLNVCMSYFWLTPLAMLLFYVHFWTRKHCLSCGLKVGAPWLIIFEFTDSIALYLICSLCRAALKARDCDVIYTMVSLSKIRVFHQSNINVFVSLCIISFFIFYCWSRLKFCT
jgi:hypothetical protein